MIYTLGIDLGTSYFKAGLFDADGVLRGLGRVEVKKQVDDGVRCELGVDNFWRFLQQAVEQAKTGANAKATDIIAVGYSSQANSFMLLGQNEVPLTPLILWPDKRAGTVYPEVRQLWGQSGFVQTTGIGVDCGSGCCVNKLLWFQSHQSQIWDKTVKILTISDYLVYSLTGRHVCDAGTASLLGILDIHDVSWNNAALAALHLDINKLATPMLPGTVAGPIAHRDIAERLGLPVGIPFVLGSLDHYMAAVGAGLGTTAQATISLGTVAACVNQTPYYVPQNGVCIARAVQGQGCHQLTSHKNGAVVLEWYNRTHCPNLNIVQLIEQAARVPADCEGLIAKPNANQYGDLQGFENIRKMHSHGHFSRAIMQSVAETLKQLIGQLSPGRMPARIAATGGGAKSPLWLSVCSQTLGSEVVAANSAEPACRGTAMTAGSCL